MKLRLILFFLLSCSLLYGQSSNESLPSYSPKGSLSLRSNIVSWLILTPNVGIEYKTSDYIGLLVDGGWAHWNVNMTNRYWRMWNISPQMRYYSAESKYNYIGLQYTIGQYNLTGNQGKYTGGSLTLGHQFYAGKNLMIDLGFSFGYLYVYGKEEYKRIDSIDYRISNKTANGYWGPTGLSVALVWKIN